MPARARAIVCAALLVLAGLAAAQPAPAPVVPLNVITFGGGWNLPFWAALRQGFFDANGVAVNLAYTPSSEALVNGLYGGKYDIAFATVDNFIAYDEGQGEVALPGEADFAVVMGGDGGFLSVMGGPNVK